jgi:hypothetical protein
MVGIDSRNIQNTLTAINPTKVETNQLANSIAGNQNVNNDRIDLVKLSVALNDLAKNNKPVFSQIVDLMSKENGGKDEFFTNEGLIAFRKALIQQGTPLDATKVKAAFDQVKQKNSFNGEAAVGVEDLASTDVTIEAHLRVMLGIQGDGNTGTDMAGAEPVAELANGTEAVLTPQGKRVDSNLTQDVQDKLATSWEVDKTSDDYAKRVKALTLVDGTTDINRLVALDSLDVMNGIDAGLDTFMAELADAKGTFGIGYNEEKVSKAWAKYIDNMKEKVGVAESSWGQRSEQLKKISPKFLLLILNEEKNPLDKDGNPQEASWIVNMMYSNGVANSQTGGMPKDAIIPGGYDGVKYQEALDSFLAFASQGKEQGFKFYSKEELANHQNIYDSGKSDAFWAKHPSLHKYMQQTNKPIADNNQALMNKYLEDMRSAGLIKIDDMHNYLFKFDEGDKLAAIAHSTANSIEAKHGKGEGEERRIPLVNGKHPDLADIYNGIAPSKLIAERNRIYLTEEADLPQKVTAKNVLDSLTGSSYKGSLNQDNITQLMQEYYGKDVLPDNKWFSLTKGEDASVVTKRIRAGLEYQATEEFKKADAVTQEKGLREKMNAAGEPPVAAPAGTAGAGGSTMTPEQQQVQNEKFNRFLTSKGLNNDTFKDLSAEKQTAYIEECFKPRQ